MPDRLDICGRACTTRFSTLLISFQCAHRRAICMMLSKISHLHNFITNLCRQQAEVVEIMTIKMFATQDKAMPST
jgi:hypothetical protein